MTTPPKRSKFRVQKMRQVRAESGASWMGPVHHVGPWPVLVTLLVFLGATAIALYGEKSLNYAVGQKIDQPIVARVTFTRVDHAKTTQSREAARANTPSYYRLDHEFVDRIRGELTKLYQAAKAAETYEQFVEEAKKADWPVDDGTYNLLHPRADEAGADAYKSWVEDLRRSLTHEYSAQSMSEERREPPSKTGHILVAASEPEGESRQEAGPVKVDIVDVVQITNRKSVLGWAGVLAKSFPFQMRASVEAFLASRLGQAPILVYDQAATLEAMSRADRDVEDVKVTYEKGKPFVFPPESDKGREAGLTAEDLSLLRLEQEQFKAFLATNDPEARELRRQKYLAQAGTAGILAMISAAIFGYVGHFQRRVLENRTRTIAFAALVLGALMATRLMDMHPTLRNLAPVPVLLATSVVALAYDPRFAVGTMAVLALMIVVTIQGDIRTFATLVGGLTVLGALLDDVRTRTQMITTGMAAATVMFATGFSFALITRQDLAFSVRTAGWAALSAVLAALLVQAVLPYVERAFKIATSLTLLEWRDANKPLLQLLVREAPGTYNHSLVLGTMAQAAAEAIGANGLLAQVGALYHDIGKIHQSEYYAENQEASINRHEKLEPRMSLLVILSHVKNGLALASEYGLPRILHQFIGEHHGTTVVRYFHHAASERQPRIASGKHDREVSESEFRYEGPKPQSKESAILMLCDGVEGTVRAMQEPTAGRIESAVHAVLMDRLQDGQFDDCDITLKELYRVEESLVKSLCRFYHGRVPYPKGGRKPVPEEPAPADQTEPSSKASAG